MENTKQLSSTPMITSIIGFVAAIPGTLCSLVCAGSADAFTSAATNGQAGGEATKIWMIMFLIPVVGGLISGFMAKSNPKLYGWILVLCALSCLIGAMVTLNWFWGLITTACFLIGGAVSLTHKS